MKPENIKMPKNNIISMKLDDKTTKTIVEMAWKNHTTPTTQAKLLLALGLNPPLLNMPTEIAKQLNECAKKHGRTAQEQAKQSLTDGLELQSTISAVSDYLAKNEKPPFSSDNWKPNESECINFIKRCVAQNIGKN